MLVFLLGFGSVWQREDVDPEPTSIFPSITEIKRNKGI
jgi:hypothetical protein